MSDDEHNLEPAAFLEQHKKEAVKDLQNAESPMEKERYRAWRDCCSALAQIARSERWMRLERFRALFDDLEADLYEGELFIDRTPAEWMERRRRNG